MTAVSLQTIAERSGLSTTALNGERVPILDTEESFVNDFSGIVMILGAAHQLGAGKLYTTSRRLIWVADTGQALSIPFVVISMHAISSDPSFSDKPCIYCQLDQPAHLAASLDADDTIDSCEMKLVTDSTEEANLLFQALCDGAEANPDEVEEDEGDFFFDEDEVTAGLDDEARARLEAMEERLQLPSAQEFDELLAGDPKRFEDAEDDVSE